MPQRDVIVVGGSAGSFPVLRQMLPALPADLPASVFVVMHMGGTGLPEFAAELDRSAALPVAQAVDGQPVEPGRIVVAAPNRHLLLLDGVVRLGRGPKENMARPAIDPLFRSAALAYGSRVIGVVLSGLLDDGAAGLHAIAERGGATVVQNPRDAIAASMPRAALEAVEADRVVRAADLAGALVELSREDAPQAPSPDPGLELEVRIAAGGLAEPERLRQIATPSILTCPSCQGVLSVIDGEHPLRFRCQTGHAFAAETALAAQQKHLEDALVVALRIVEERLALVRRMAREARAAGRNAVAELNEARLEEYARYAEVLRQAAASRL
jgi:two-component system chemotaxis response regulator CheB